MSRMFSPLGKLRKRPGTARAGGKIDLDEVRRLALERAAAENVDIDVEKKLIDVIADREMLDPETRTAAALAVARELMGVGAGRR